MGEQTVPAIIASSLINQWNYDFSNEDDEYDNDALDSETKADTYAGLSITSAMLETKWHQESPFNNFRSDGYPAGCVAIATAQIIEFNAINHGYDHFTIDNNKQFIVSQAGVLSIRKSCFWIMLYLLFIQILAPVLFKPVDELGVLFLLVIMSLDMAVNRQVMRYKGAFIAVGIMAFYAIYSMTALKFNTTKAILVDFVIELKPFVPFFIGYAIAPRFTPRERQVMKIASVVITFCLLLIFVTDTVDEIIFHVAYIGSTAFICFLTYIYCSVREDNTISKRDMAIAFAILAVGLCSTRSKYFGEAVFAVFMFLLYKPGAFRKIGAKQIVVAILVLLTVLAVSWQKINYYFIVGNGDIPVTVSLLQTTTEKRC